MNPLLLPAEEHNLTYAFQVVQMDFWSGETYTVAVYTDEHMAKAAAERLQKSADDNEVSDSFFVRTVPLIGA